MDKSIKIALLLLLVLDSSSLNAQNDSITLPQAREHARLADELYLNPQASIFHAGLALAFFESGDYPDEAVALRNGLSEIYRRARDTTNWENNATTAYHLAINQLVAGDAIRINAANNYALVLRAVYQDFRGSRRILEQAYEALPKPEDPNLSGGLLYNIGSDYFTMGDFRTAGKYYQAAADQYSRKQDTLAFLILRASIESFRVQTALGNYSLAISNARTALARAAGQPGTSTEALRGKIHLAEIYCKSNQAEAAILLLDSLFNTPNLSPNNLFDINYHRAVVYHQTDNKDGLDNSLDFLSHHRPASPIKMARLLRLQAQQALTQGEAMLANSLLNEALAELCLGYTPPVISKECLINTRSAYELNFILHDLAKLQAVTPALGGRHAALTTYHKIIHLNDLARNRYQSKDAQLLLLNGNQEIFEGALGIVWELQQEAASPNLNEMALFLIEKSKRTLLRDEIASRALSGSDEVLSTYLNRLYALRANLARARQLAPAGATVLGVERKMDQLEDTIATRYPKYALAASERLPTLDDIHRQVIREDGAFLTFFSGPSWLYKLIITNAEITLQRLPAAYFTSRAITEFNDLLRLSDKNQIDRYDSIGLQWEEMLVTSKHFSPAITRLIISPDGPLAALPFAALLTSTPKEGKFPFLLYKYRIQFVSSLTTLPTTERISNNAMGILGVYPLFEGEDRFQSDVAAAVDNFSKYQGNHLVGKAATREGFQAHLNKYDILLFATHARANDARYLEPSISFIDGDLRLSDLAGKRMSATMVILSACETGLGKLEPGEGTMSLARGFNYAGVRTVLMSLWSVPELATMNHIGRLLRELSGEKSAAESIRLAQLTYLRDKNIPIAEKAPYYWAGLVCVGADTKVTLKKRLPRIWSLVGIMGVFAIFFGGYLVYSAKKTSPK